MVIKLRLLVFCCYCCDFLSVHFLGHLISAMVVDGRLCVVDVAFACCQLGRYQRDGLSFLP